MRTIRVKRHRKVVSLPNAELALLRVKARVHEFMRKEGSVDAIIDCIEWETCRLRKQFLYAEEFEVPEGR